MPSFLFLFTMLGFVVILNADINTTFAECCRGIGLKEYTVNDACKYPPSADISYRQQFDLSRHFNGYFGCYAAHMDNTDCCRKGGVKGSCVDVCNGANPPGWPNPKYMDCKQYGSINVCNQNAAQEADNEKTLKSNSEAKMTKPLAQKHMGMKDNVKHLEHLVVQQA